MISRDFLSRLARWLMLSLVSVLLAGCDLPKDPDGTLDRVHDSRTFQVGIFGGEDGPRISERQFLARLSRELGAVPEVTEGIAEDLLTRLENGELDLVVGQFHTSSPWAERVAFVPDLEKLADGGDGTVLAAAARNGENAWIGRLHEASTKIGGDR